VVPTKSFYGRLYDGNERVGQASFKKEGCGWSWGSWGGDCDCGGDTAGNATERSGIDFARALCVLALRLAFAAALSQTQTQSACMGAAQRATAPMRGLSEQTRLSVRAREVHQQRTGRPSLTRIDLGLSRPEPSAEIWPHLPSGLPAQPCIPARARRLIPPPTASHALAAARNNKQAHFQPAAGTARPLPAVSLLARPSAPWACAAVATVVRCPCQASFATPEGRFHNNTATWGLARARARSPSWFSLSQGFRALLSAFTTDTQLLLPPRPRPRPPACPPSC
jgi:hypothetical protein